MLAAGRSTPLASERDWGGWEGVTGGSGSESTKVNGDGGCQDSGREWRERRRKVRRLLVREREARGRWRAVEGEREGGGGA